MPRCNVFGPRDIDVALIVTQNFPDATVIKFDEDKSVIAIFPENPTDRLKELGLHVVVWEGHLSSVFWQPFIIRGGLGTSPEDERKIPDILRQRFNVRPMRERARFEIPIPVPDDSIDLAERRRLEFDLRMKAVDDIQKLMKSNGIHLEIGLAR